MTGKTGMLVPLDWEDCEPDPQPEEFDPPSTQTECVKCKEKFWAMDRYTNICEDCFGKL